MGKQWTRKGQPRSSAGVSEPGRDCERKENAGKRKGVRCQ